MTLENDPGSEREPPMVPKSTQTELNLQAIDDYPLLKSCLALWETARGEDALPVAIDVADLPDSIIDYSMILDYLPEDGDAYVRMVGNYIGERATFQAEGMCMRAFFDDRDAAIIADSLARIAENRRPSLAKRTHVPIAGEQLSYTRLILPLSANGRSVTGFFKTIEPGSLAASPGPF